MSGEKNLTLKPVKSLYIIFGIILSIFWVVFFMVWYRNTTEYLPLIFLTVITVSVFISFQYNEIKIEDERCFIKSFPFKKKEFIIDEVVSIKTISFKDVGRKRSHSVPYAIEIALKSGERIMLNAKLYGVKELAKLSGYLENIDKKT